MISAEAPILFAKGCDIFITELTMRAWIHAEENKRRTLQRSDIASALAKSDMFDFLIDIVPREEASAHKRSAAQSSAAAQASASVSAVPPSVQQQAGVHPPPHQMAPPDYGMQHMGQEPEYRPQPGMYPPHVQPNPTYGQPPQQMYDQGMYGGYAMAPQQVRRPPHAEVGGALTDAADADVPGRTTSTGPRPWRSNTRLQGTRW